MREVLVVDDINEGKRLDVFLNEQITDVTR
jgi:hypothetical protein